jgi:hypothetical protein
MSGGGSRPAEGGVVDPLRLPGWLREPLERAWRREPRIARLFVGLTVVDVLGRSVGLLAPAIDWAHLTPLSLVTAFLPHDLWILLPALLMLRRPDAADATPSILWGSIALAAQELLGGPLEALVGFGTAAVAVSIVAVGVRIVGWLLLARGLAALNPRLPSESVAGLSNLVAGAVGLTVALYLVDLVTRPAFDLGNPGLEQLLTLNDLLVTLAPLGWAYLLWIIVRGSGDSRRPSEAVVTATAGAVSWAFLGLLVVVLDRTLLPSQSPGPSSLRDVVTVLAWLGGVVGPTLIVAGFALGLAEPPFVAAAEPEPEPDAAGESEGPGPAILAG